MTEPLVLKIFLAFIISGLWISLATLVAEKTGSRIGGLIANLPSNIVVTYFFISFTEGNAFASKAALSVPMGMTIDSIFLFVFILGLYKNLFFAIFTSLSLWFVLAYLSIGFVSLTLLPTIIFYVLITVILFYVLEKFSTIRSIGKTKTSFNFKQICIRALFAGSVVSTTIYVASIFSEHFTGILSAFPAVLISTMIIISVNQSKQFAQAIGKVMLVSSSNIVVFSIIVHFTFVQFGPIIGTIIGFIGAILSVLILQPLMRTIK